MKQRPVLRVTSPNGIGPAGGSTREVKQRGFDAQAHGPSTGRTPRPRGGRPGRRRSERVEHERRRSNRSTASGRPTRCTDTSRSATTRRMAALPTSTRRAARGSSATRAPPTRARTRPPRRTRREATTGSSGRAPGDTRRRRHACSLPSARQRTRDRHDRALHRDRRRMRRRLRRRRRLGGRHGRRECHRGGSACVIPRPRQLQDPVPVQWARELSRQGTSGDRDRRGRLLDRCHVQQSQG